MPSKKKDPQPNYDMTKREHMALEIYLRLAPPRGYHESCATEAVAAADKLIEALEKKDDAPVV